MKMRQTLLTREKHLTNKVEFLHWKSATAPGGHVQGTRAGLKDAHLNPLASLKRLYYCRGSQPQELSVTIGGFIFAVCTRTTVSTTFFSDSSSALAQWPTLPSLQTTFFLVTTLV